jgi:hypothetical protein
MNLRHIRNENGEFTYGEAHIAEQHSMMLVDGEFTKILKVNYKPEPMSKKQTNGKSQAGQYYTNKMAKFWAEQVEFPKTVKGRKLKKVVPDSAKLAVVMFMIKGVK